MIIVARHELGMIHQSIQGSYRSCPEYTFSYGAPTVANSENRVQVVLYQHEPGVDIAAIHVVVVAVAVGESGLAVIEECVKSKEAKPLLGISHTLDLADIITVGRIVAEDPCQFDERSCLYPRCVRQFWTGYGFLE